MSAVRCSRCGALVPRGDWAAHVPCQGPQQGAQDAPGEALGWGSLVLPQGHQQRRGPGNQQPLPGMQGQPPTAPYVPGSDTSRAAAESMRPHLRGLRRDVYDHMGQAGERGYTCDELEVVLEAERGHWPAAHQTVSACIRGMVLDGWLVDSGRRRRTRSGRTARVYVVVPLRQ